MDLIAPVVPGPILMMNETAAQNTAKMERRLLQKKLLLKK